MRRSLARLAYPLTVLVLVAGIVGLAGFLAVVALPDLTGAASRGPAAQSPSAPAGSPGPGPTSAMARSPIGIPMPSDANCGACHTTSAGGVGVRQIPVLGHPLKGFGNCTACHNQEGLVKTAPGHSSLHADQCLVCHQENPNAGTLSAAPMRPEHMSGQACGTCHGVDQHAPLPSSMAGRGNNCWICHNGPEFEYLFTSPSAAPPGAPSPSPPGGTLAPPSLPAP